MKENVKIALGLIAAVILLILASTLDHAEDVVYRMPQAAYDEIVSKIGRNATSYEIAREYGKHVEYYNSLQK